jgi:hypothetical protein
MLALPDTRYDQANARPGTICEKPGEKHQPSPLRLVNMENLVNVVNVVVWWVSET